MSVPWVNIVTALPAEAKPIVARFGLQRVQSQPAFPIYGAGQTRLAVCMPGKINAAAATAYLGALCGGRADAIWVNVGAAGHASRKLGQALLADKITDAGSGNSWCPSLPSRVPFPSEPLLTLDRADMSYEQGCLVDMEASGFYATALRFSPAELIQVLKIISDNREHPARGLSAKQLRWLVSDALESIEKLIALLAETANELQGPDP